MTPNIFVTNEAGICEKIIEYSDFVEALVKKSEDSKFNLTHMALGIAGEAGELVDAIKKHAVYNKELDRTNVIEELGDLMWYMQGLMNITDITWQEIIQANYYKLAERYKGLVYTDEAAIARADKKEVTVGFIHDLEDGWFYLSQKDVPTINRNHWKDIEFIIKEKSFKAVWEGNTYYKPDSELLV